MCSKVVGDVNDLVVVGVDIGKDVFHLVGFDCDGNLVLRRKIKRLALTATFEGLPRCVVGMEACLSAHFVSRTLRGLGFETRIIPAISGAAPNNLSAPETSRNASSMEIRSTSGV